MTMGAATIPDVLVSTDWVAQHLNDTNIRIVEVDVDTAAYDQGHVPNAIAWNWTTELCDTLVRDIIPPAKFEALMAKSGIGNDTTVILYGDNNNWFAAWALWQMKVYGHQDVRIMNGGRKKWLAEGRELGSQTPSLAPATYRAAAADLSLRAFLPEVQAAVKSAVPHWSTCEARPSSPARSSRLPAFPKRVSAAGTSPAPRASRGARPATKTARSRAPTTCGSSTAAQASRPTGPSSRTAASANDRAIPGSC